MDEEFENDEIETEMAIDLEDLGWGDDDGDKPVPLAAQLIKNKHREYLKSSQRNKFLYYGTRLLAGLAAVILPFVVQSYPTIATVLSVIVAVTIVIDYVFDPKSKWVLYSRATDLLAIAELKSRGEYDKYEEALEILLTTEEQSLASLKELENVVRKAQSLRE